MTSSNTFTALLALCKRTPSVIGGFPFTKASDTGFWWFLRSAPEQTDEQTIDTPVIWDAIAVIKDRAHLSTFKFFILEKFSCIVVLIVFFVIVQSSGLTHVWFREKTTFFLNFISFHIFAIYVGGACWGLPAACGLIAVSGARLPSVDGLTVRYIKNAPLLNMPSKYVCNLFQTCFRYMYVWYKHTGTLPLCLQVALSFIWLD